MANQEEEISPINDDDYVGEKNREVFLPYRCHSLGDITNCKKHPGNVVEAASLAAQILPPTNYPLKEAFPPHLIQQGKLSDLQLEGILHACQRHQIMLSDHTRAGFYLGDAAGVGKGRQIAGIIINNYVRGRRKHLWFSASHDLRLDAERDLKDLNCSIRIIDGCQELDRQTRVGGIPTEISNGILFNTYHTLISTGQRGSTSTRGSRLEQILDWCGGQNFNGCLIFDECHKAKNFIPGNETVSTKTAKAAVNLQRKLPKARVVYCSATGVTNVKNMAFMERLGLWGQTTAFKTVENFIQAMTTHGLGASEMLAIEMKAAGMYVSRGLSFESAEFHTVEINLTDQQIEIYNLSVRVWQKLARDIKTAIDCTDGPSATLWAVYWGCHQRFFKLLCMSLKVPAIIQEAKSALQQGYCVVIGLQTTGEASLEKELDRHGTHNNRSFVSTTKEILVRFISKYFPTKEKTPNGPKTHPWCKNAVEALLQLIDTINLPNNPLDELIHQLGGINRVAEMTGRRGRMVCINGNPNPIYQLRGTNNRVRSVESLNVKEKNLFMQGKKLIAIISDAASTGTSLHSDTRVANQRRRVHITLELPWSAEKAVQQLGRSHRSNQSSAPIYKLMTTDVGGEKRFVAAVAHRLLSLGALTRGDRRAATGADFSQFNYNTNYGRTALKLMYSHILGGTLYSNIRFSSILSEAHVSDKSYYTETQFHQDMEQSLLEMDLIKPLRGRAAGEHVIRFLNRILGLRIERQNLLFTYFCKCLDSRIEQAKKDGEYDEGITDIKGTSIVMIGSPKEIFTQVKRGNFSTKQITLRIDRGVDWPTALKLYKEQATNPLDGFYHYYDDKFRRNCYFLAIRKTRSDFFRIIRPDTGFSRYKENCENLIQKYTKTLSKVAKHEWEEHYRLAGQERTRGGRISSVHILYGGIIPMLSLLDSMLANLAGKFKLTKEQQKLRIVRVQLDNGNRVIGLRYPEPIIEEMAKLLKWAATQQHIIQGQCHQNLLESATNLPSVFDGDTCKQGPLIDALLPIISGGTTARTIKEEHSVDQHLLKKIFSNPLSFQSVTTHPNDRKQEIKVYNSIKNGSCSKNSNINDDSEIVTISDESDLPSSNNSDDGEIFTIPYESDLLSSYNNDDGDLPSSNHSDDDDIIFISATSSLSPSKPLNSSIHDNTKANEVQKSGHKRYSKNTLSLTTTNKKNKELKVFDDFQQNSQTLTYNCNSYQDLSSDDNLHCPICDYRFSSGTDNQVINQHLDECLASVDEGLDYPF